VSSVESITHAGVTVTLVRTDPPGVVVPARWYQARKYDVQWYDVFLSHVDGERGDKIGGVERFKTKGGGRASAIPSANRQYNQLRWRYYTDDYAPATTMAYATRRAALEDLLRNSPGLADVHRRDIKRLTEVTRA